MPAPSGQRLGFSLEAEVRGVRGADRRDSPNALVARRRGAAPTRGRPLALSSRVCSTKYEVARRHFASPVHGVHHALSELPHTSYSVLLYCGLPVAIENHGEKRRTILSFVHAKERTAKSVTSFPVAATNQAFRSVHWLKFGFPFFSAVVIGRFTSAPYVAPR